MIMLDTAPDTKKQLLISTKKAMGMLNKINEMIMTDTYCADIAQQINATMGLLKKMNFVLLKSHLKCCGKGRLSAKTPEEVDAFLDEFFRVIDVSLKL